MSKLVQTGFFLMDKELLMEKGWYEKLKDEFSKPYLQNLQKFLQEQYQKNHIIYPPKEKIFQAFCVPAFNQVKVVIVGQDPYHNPGQAIGLSFSVAPGVKQPPSLKNIFKEIQDDLGIKPPSHGCLLHWAKQGICLLNATLTVRKNEPKSHYGKGWENFTDAAISILAKREDPIVFMLWGKSAQEKCEHIGIAKHHLILKSAHPSPYSAYSGFFGCQHFSKANSFLEKVGKEPIDWSVPEVQ